MPRSSAEVRRLVIHDTKEVEGVRQQEQQEDERDEKEKWSEWRTRRDQRKHSPCSRKDEDDHGMNEDSNLSYSVRASNNEDSQKTTTLTDNKKRYYENEGSSMHQDSCIGINYAHRFTKCFRLRHTSWEFSLSTSCRRFILSLYQFVKFMTCTRLPCRDAHFENGHVRCCLSLHITSCSPTSSKMVSFVNCISPRKRNSK